MMALVKAAINLWSGTDSGQVSARDNLMNSWLGAGSAVESTASLHHVQSSVECFNNSLLVSWALGTTTGTRLLALGRLVDKLHGLLHLSFLYWLI